MCKSVCVFVVGGICVTWSFERESCAQKDCVPSSFSFLISFFSPWCFPIIDGATRGLKRCDTPVLKSESWGVCKMNLDQNIVSMGKGIRVCLGP